MVTEATMDAATANSVADFTCAGLIVPYLRERDSAGVIGELTRRLGRLDCVPDALAFYQAALNQNLLSGLPTPRGIAIAHARLAGIRRLSFAFGRTPAPVVWGAREMWPVRLVFLLAVPLTDSSSYLQLLSKLAGLGQGPETVKELLAPSNAAGIMAVFQKIQLSK